MQNLPLPESNDRDYFFQTLSTIKEKELRPDLIGSIITHYASKWLPESSNKGPINALSRPVEAQPESATVSWMKKKFFIETLIGILPQDKDSVPCDSLLRLLRITNMVQAEPACQAELEKRISWQLDRASLNELMIPSFDHTCTTLLDFDLVLRLVNKFVSAQVVRCNNGDAMVKVAKLVDSYLAEAAVDSQLRSTEFVALTSVIPGRARAMSDGLYRAVDTYLKAHPGLSKQERKTLCNLVDIKKLSQEACIHASQNERLPVRAVIQVLLSNLNKHVIDYSGSLISARSPIGFGVSARSPIGLGVSAQSPIGLGVSARSPIGLGGSGRSPIGLDVSAQSFSKRETTSFQKIEIKRLKEDVLRLQSQCMYMEKQIEKLVENKKSSYGVSWKKLGILVFKGKKSTCEVEGEDFGLKTPLEMKRMLVRGTTSNWRKSMS